MVRIRKSRREGNNLNKKKNNNQRDILKKWLPVFLWLAVIFSLSSIRQVKVSEFFLWDFVLKKIAHVGEYAILYALLFRATNGKWAHSYILTLAYALTDEFHQHFVPGRSANPLDLGFDSSGANISAYLIWKLKHVLQAKQKK